MADAVRDQNFVPGKMAVLNTDTVQGTNKVRIGVDEATGSMKVTTTATISFTMEPVGARDANYVDCALFVGQDGLAYPWVANSDGEVLIDSI